MISWAFKAIKIVRFAELLLSRLHSMTLTSILSPCLFILALESLLVAIKQNKDITGIEVEGKEIKCTAFADDLTNFPRDKKSYEALNSLLDPYGDCSGLKVNKEKRKPTSEEVLTKIMKLSI